jgi:hypothetical protein
MELDDSDSECASSSSSSAGSKAARSVANIVGQFVKLSSGRQRFAAKASSESEEKQTTPSTASGSILPSGSSQAFVATITPVAERTHHKSAVEVRVSQIARLNCLLFTKFCSFFAAGFGEVIGCCSEGEKKGNQEAEQGSSRKEAKGPRCE